MNVSKFSNIIIDKWDKIFFTTHWFSITSILKMTVGKQLFRGYFVCVCVCVCSYIFGYNNDMPIPSQKL